MLSGMTFNRGRYPARPRPTRPHAFVVGLLVGQRIVERVTTTRVVLKCKCGTVSAVPIRRLEQEGPQSCRRCATKIKPGTRGAVAEMSIGQRFGSRTVTGFDVRPKSEGCTRVALTCDCGAEGFALPRHLLAGIATRCDSCADTWRGVPLRSRARSG